VLTLKKVKTTLYVTIQTLKNKRLDFLNTIWIHGFKTRFYSKTISKWQA
jgi:hypothetical protein